MTRCSDRVQLAHPHVAEHLTGQDLAESSRRVGSVAEQPTSTSALANFSNSLDRSLRVGREEPLHAAAQRIGSPKQVDSCQRHRPCA